MNIKDKLPLKAHGASTELFSLMILNLKQEETDLLVQAIDTVPQHQRGFIAQSIKPYLARLDEARHTRRDAAMRLHSHRAMEAMYHAIALTRMYDFFDLHNMDDKEAGFLLEGVVYKVFFFPSGVAGAFHKDDKFTMTACGAAVMVLDGDTKTRCRREYAYIGEQAMLEAESEETSMTALAA